MFGGEVRLFPFLEKKLLEVTSNRFRIISPRTGALDKIFGKEDVDSPFFGAVNHPILDQEAGLQAWPDLEKLQFTIVDDAAYLIHPERPAAKIEPADSTERTWQWTFKKAEFFPSYYVPSDSLNTGLADNPIRFNSIQKYRNTGLKGSGNNTISYVSNDSPILQVTVDLKNALNFQITGPPPAIPRRHWLQFINPGTIYAPIAVTAVYPGDVESPPMYLFSVGEVESGANVGNVHIGVTKQDSNTLFFRVYLRRGEDRWNSRGWGYIGLIDVRDTPAGGDADRRFEGLDNDSSLDYTRTFPNPDTDLNRGDSPRYPGSVLSFQQRLFLTGGTGAPDEITASKIANRQNFDWDITGRDIADNDAFRFDIAGENDVRHLMDLQRLVLFADTGVWVANKGGGALTPSNINLERAVSEGASRIPPIAFDVNALYVQDRNENNLSGDVVRAFGYNIEVDGYAGSDLTIFCLLYTSPSPRD